MSRSSANRRGILAMIGSTALFSANDAATCCTGSECVMEKCAQPKPAPLPPASRRSRTSRAGILQRCRA